MNRLTWFMGGVFSLFFSAFPKPSSAQLPASIVSPPGARWVALVSPAGKPIFSAISTGNRYTIPDVVVEETFLPGRTYYVRIKGLDESENPVGDGGPRNFILGRGVRLRHPWFRMQKLATGSSIKYEEVRFHETPW